MNPIEEGLAKAGFKEEDIKITQSLARRASDSHSALVNSIRACESCSFASGCYGAGEDTPWIMTEPTIGTGPWNSPLMIIDDRPGQHEGNTKIPFIGVTGQIISLILAKAGVDRNAVYMTYAVKCANPREPKIHEAQLCKMKHIAAEIEAVNPAIILTTGHLAAYSLKPNSQNQFSISEQRNQIHEYTLSTGKKVKAVHTYSMMELVEPSDPNIRYKGEIWQDISLAVAEAKKAKPNYTYDRVGLDALGGK